MEIIGKTVATVEVKSMAGRDTFKDTVTWERTVITFTDDSNVQFDSWDGEVYDEFEYTETDENDQPIPIEPEDDPDEIHTPMMGWQDCRYKFEGADTDGTKYYHCLTHDDTTQGHEVSCERAYYANTGKWTVIAHDEFGVTVEASDQDAEALANKIASWAQQEENRWPEFGLIYMLIEPVDTMYVEVADAADNAV